MKDCDRLTATLRAHVAGESSPDGGEPLVRHAEVCADCRALLELHGTLVDLGRRAAEDEPAPADFAAMRSAVLRRTAPERAAAAVRPGARRPRSPLVTLRPLSAAAAGLLLLVAGFAASHLRFERAGVSADELLLREITEEAAANRSLVDVENSPFIYSDVGFRRLANGRVGLDFVVTRHVSTVQPAGAALVQEVLAQSLLNPSHTGSRLKAISLAAGSMSPKVRDALIFALHHDDSLAVRLKALSILAQQPAAGAAIESAVLATLREDESVQMRLHALDYLATQRLDPQALRRALEPAGDPGAAALMVRLAEYERAAP
jgi:hypothetical protein